MRAPQRFWGSAHSTLSTKAVTTAVGGSLVISLAGCLPFPDATPAAEEGAANVEHVQRPVESGSDAKISAEEPTLMQDAEANGEQDPDVVRDTNLEDRNLMPKRDATSTAPAQSPSSTTRHKTVPVYWVGDTAEGLKLFREFRRFQDYGDPIATSVMAAFNGRPLDPDYAHHLPSIDGVGVSLALDNSITLDFPAEAFDRRYTSDLAQMLIQQIVYSATAAAAQASLGDPDELYRVRILVDGKANQRVFSAVELADEYQRDNAAIAAVWIIDPQEGQTLSPDLEVKGLSTSDSEALEWTLYQSGEDSDSWTQIDFGTVSLESGTSIFSQVYTLRKRLEPGAYRLQVKDPVSTTVDSKDFNIQGN